MAVIDAIFTTLNKREIVDRKRRGFAQIRRIDAIIIDKSLNAGCEKKGVRLGGMLDFG